MYYLYCWTMTLKCFRKILKLFCFVNFENDGSYKINSRNKGKAGSICLINLFRVTWKNFWKIFSLFKLRVNNSNGRRNCKNKLPDNTTLVSENFKHFEFLQVTHNPSWINSPSLSPSIQLSPSMAHILKIKATIIDMNMKQLYATLTADGVIVTVKPNLYYCLFYYQYFICTACQTGST